MRLIKFLGMVVCLTAALTACSKDPTTEVNAATVGEPVVTPTPSAAVDKMKPAQGPVALEGDIIFVGSKVSGVHECRFSDWKGTFWPADEKVEFSIQTASVEADYKDPSPWSSKLARHLKGVDFFDSKQFPTATFISSSIRKMSGLGAGATHQVSGALTIRGVTREVSFPASIESERGKVSADAEFSINRKDFNVVYPGKPDDLIRDGVMLKLALRGKR
jgi:polyisoprenoid-binding protein YceI